LDRLKKDKKPIQVREISIFLDIDDFSSKLAGKAICKCPRVWVIVAAVD